MAIASLGMDYHVKGGTESFRDYIFSNIDKLKSELPNEEVSVDTSKNTITYKGKIFEVAEDGTITAVDGIALNESTKTLTIEDGVKEEFTLTASLVNITGNISWSNSAPSIVTLEGTGNSVKVKAVAKGTAVITASCSGKTATCNITVKEVKNSTTLEISLATLTMDDGETKTLTVTQNGTEEIVWESSDTSKVTVVGSGENNQTATITAVGAGTATITAKTKKSNLSKTCNITINSPYIDDSYVDYNVSYTDIYTGTKYTNLTGWRVLNKVDNGDGTSNLDIISTGIPAGLYYNYNYITNATYSPWAGTAAQITDYITNYYTSGSNTYSNMYAVSGLRYNFEKIKFKKLAEGKTYDDSEDNKGYYKEISKNGIPQTKEIDGTTFKARTGAEVRSVIHSDITGDKKSSSITVADTLDKKGLFILQNYTPDKHNDSYYWLASPDPSDYDNVRYVGYNGGVGEWGYIVYYGVRPVVSMTNVKMQRKAGNSHVWEIVD